MYTDFFGFREKPFSITPDPRFLYLNPAYEEAYANLSYGIHERRGFIVLTGEVGTGKTTLLRRLMDNLEETVRFVFFYNTTLTFEELLDFTCEELGLTVQAGKRLQKIQTLNQFLIAQLEQGGTVALLIDEAQNLGEETLENLRLLSNLETAREKLLQIVLVGQPELETKLAQPTLRQLRQRIATRCRLDRLKDHEVAPFIYYRLRLVGYERQDLFTPEAVQRIVVYSKGIPRLINIICDNALLLAYGTSKKTVSAEMIEEVASDLRLREEARGISPGIPVEEKKTSAYSGTAPLLGTQPPLPPLHTQKTAVNSREKSYNSAETPSSQYRGKRLARARLLALLLSGGAAAVYSLYHKKEFLIELVRKAEDPLGAAEAHFASFVHDLNTRLALLIPRDSDSNSILLHRPQRESLLPAHQAEPVVSSRVDRQDATVIQGGALPLDNSPQPLTGQGDGTEIQRQFSGGEPTPYTSRSQEVTRKHQFFTVLQPGATVSGMVLERYGSYNALVLDLIKELNPHIADLDRVVAGETLQLPPLTRDTLLRQQTDHSYCLILASFRNQTGAERFAQSVRRRGYTVKITERKVAESLLLHRVEIVRLKNLEEVHQAWELVNVSNLLTDVPTPAGTPLITDGSASQDGAVKFVERKL
jgi:general secretion pathway protein A